MYSLQDPVVRGSMKFNKYINCLSDDKENEDTSNNSNLLSSNSSYKKNNVTGYSNRESKNLNESKNFDESQNEMSRSKTKFQKHHKEFPNK